MLLFGCRPSEAAYIIHRHSFYPNTFSEFAGCDWVATVPPGYNKTKQLYKWPVPPKMIWMVELLHELHDPEYKLKDRLGEPKTKGTKDLDNWFR